MGSRPSITSPNREIVAEASAWFVEFREGNVPAAIRARFDEWLRRSPEHIQAYLEVSAAWSELPTADPEGRIDVEALVTRARATADDNVVAVASLGVSGAPEGRPHLFLEKRTENPHPQSDVVPRQAKRSRGFYGVLPIAASVILVTALTALVVWLAPFHTDTYSTGIGEQRTVRLADGSTIELNALSKLHVHLSKDRRDIELTAGQALFHVAKDRSRPFIVRSGVATVRAVGTQFDVYRKLSGTTVTVLEGEVAVLPTSTANAPPSADEPGSRAADAVLLDAGQQVTVTPRQVSKPKKADTTAATAWTQQRLIFDATPIADVADEFNRYNVKKLVIADSILGTVGVSGVYSSSDPASLIGFLRAQPNLQLTETDSEIRVTRRETH